MLVIEYGPGEAVSDFGVEELYNALVCTSLDKRIEVAFSTANIFNRVRLGIAQDDMDCEQVIFLWKGEYITINEFGALSRWPEDFLDQAWYAVDILRAATAKQKGIYENQNR